MDKKYNVWARTGNRWDPVLNMTVSQSTAEALVSLLSYENDVPKDDIRFTVSIGKPMSIGFDPDTVNVASTRRKLK